MSETPPPGWGQPAGPPPGPGQPPSPPGGGAPSGGWGQPPGGAAPPGPPPPSGGYGQPTGGWGQPSPGGPGPGGPPPGGYGAPPEQFGQAGAPPPGQPSEKGRGLVIGLIVLIVLVIIGGLGVALLIASGDDDPEVATPTTTTTPGEETDAGPDDGDEPGTGSAPATAPEDPDAEPTSPTAAPTPSPFDPPADEQPAAPVDGVDQSVFELSVGTCFNDPGSADAIQSVGAVPCETPHDNEVFGLIEFPAGPDEPFPGREPLSVFGDEQCQGQIFADYVGIGYVNSRYFASQLTPTDGSWEQGDREIVCVLYDTAAQITGSVRGTAE